MSDYVFTPLAGSAPALQRVLHAARLVAAADVPVLIRGERGTGRLALAAEIHRLSIRREARLQRIAATRLTADAFEATCAAGRATLVIEEVEGLPLETQPLLAEYLARREGGDETAAAVRLVATTSQELREWMVEGRFSADLFYRLQVIPLDMPALRERREDLALLAQGVMRELAQRHGRRPPLLSPTASHLLRDYAWPGNLTELRALCERFVVMFAGERIGAEDLPAEILSGKGASQGRGGFVLPPEGVNLDTLEADVIRQAVTMTGGNRSRAARLLGITRDTLLYRLRKYAIADSN